MAFTRNPLYREFDRAMRNEARRAFQQSEAYKLVKDIRHAINTPHQVSSSVSQFSDMLQRYSRHGFSGGFFKSASRVPFRDMVREVIRYQASGGESARLIGQLLGALGPFGRLIKSFISPGSKVRGSGIEAEIDAAVRMLQAFAPDKLSPELRVTTAGQVADSLEAAVARLEAEGYQVSGPGAPAPSPMQDMGGFATLPPRIRPLPIVHIPKGPGPGRIRPIPKRRPQRPEPPAPVAPKPVIDDPLTSDEQLFYPTGIPKSTSTGQGRQVVDLEGRRFPVTHPVITKEMQRVESSNVYSIGYDYDSRTLYVRYKANKEFGGGMGSVYAYDGVSLQKALSLFDAPSKGVWMWDNVRIRGTWSGHRHQYRLVAVRNDYVPRMATYAGGGREMFVPRTVQVFHKKRGLRTLTSQLPEEYAPLMMPMDGSPDRGEPNRGSPNRGR